MTGLLGQERPTRVGRRKREHTPVTAPAESSVDKAARPGLLWVLPAGLFFALFAGLPLILVAVLSFTSWDGLGSPEFNGFENWTRVFSDSAVWESLRISLVLMVLCWAVQTPLALLLGVWAAGHQFNRTVL